MVRKSSARDLLLCAKNLFVGAKHGLPAKLRHREPVFIAGDRLAMLQVVSHECPEFLPGAWALHAVNRCSKGREVAWIREAMDYTVAI